MPGIKVPYWLRGWLVTAGRRAGASSWRMGETPVSGRFGLWDLYHAP
jgi:hypothetical protein